MPLGYVREISYTPRTPRRPTRKGPARASASGAGGAAAAAGLLVEPQKRQWLPVVRAGDEQVVHLSVGTKPPLRWEAVSFRKYDKLREWGARDQHESVEEEPVVAVRARKSSDITARRRSVQALEQLRADLMSHSTAVPSFRYRGAPGVWDAIQNNANQECVQMRRSIEAEKETPSRANLTRLVPAEDPLRPLYLTCVVLIYRAPCNPLSLESIQMLRRARQAVEAFHRVVVAGAVVMPYSHAALEQHFQGESSAVLLPFDFRMEMAHSVIESAGQEWILTDNCGETCLANAPGNLLDYFSEYCRSRLYDPGFDTKALEVTEEDTLWHLHPSDKMHRVPSNAYGKVPEVSPFQPVKEVRAVLVECPKQVHCKELLRRAIWLMCRREETTAAFDVLRRFLGLPAAEMLQRWAAHPR